jgi:peroxiredoxin Q/BCP
MPRKAATAGDDSAQAEQAPRRSTRLASQPKTEEAKPASKPRVAKKRTADDANAAGAVEGGGEQKGKAKKVGFLTPFSDAATQADRTCFFVNRRVS